MVVTTVYVKNLCTRTKKAELKRSLYGYFCQYGRVVDVVALKTPKARGQAFVVFAEPACAGIALREAEGQEFYGKPMVVQLAKTPSRAVAEPEIAGQKRLANNEEPTKIPRLE